MRRSVPLAAALPLLLLALAPADEPQVDGPRLAVASKDLSFGEIVQGSIYELTVPIESRGTQPLRLTRVEAPCSCTVTRFTADPIPPGQRGEVRIRFDSATKLGYQAFRLTVYSNDPTQADMGMFCTVLTLRGEVRTLFRLAPSGIFFGEVVRGGEPVERRLTLTGTGPARTFQARIVGELPSYLEARVEPCAPQTGAPQGVLVVVRLLPHVPVGEVNVPLDIETGVPEQPRLQVPIVGVVSGIVRGPDVVQLGRIPRATGVEQVVLVERRDSVEELPLREVEFDRALLDVTTSVLTPQRLEVRIVVRPGAPPGPLATVVRFVFDLPRDPVVAFPVFALVVPRVEVEPAVLWVGPVPAQGGALGGVVARGGTVRAARVEPQDAGLTASIAVAPGEAAVEVSARAGATVPAGARLVLETDVPGEERVVVPIRGR